MKVDIDKLNQNCQGSLVEHLGIVFTEFNQEGLWATMPVDQRTVQPFGILHGGASCCLAETLGSVAAQIFQTNPDHSSVGLNIEVHHIRKVNSPNQVTAVVSPLHLGKMTQLWEIKIFNCKKELVSHAKLTTMTLHA